MSARTFVYAFCGRSTWRALELLYADDRAIDFTGDRTFSHWTLRAFDLAGARTFVHGILRAINFGGARTVRSNFLRAIDSVGARTFVHKTLRALDSFGAGLYGRSIQQSIPPGATLQQTAKQSAATAAILIQKPIVIITAVTTTARQKIPAINPLTPSINLKKPTAATAHHTGKTIEIIITR